MKEPIKYSLGADEKSPLVQIALRGFDSCAPLSAITIARLLEKLPTNHLSKLSEIEYINEYLHRKVGGFFRRRVFKGAYYHLEERRIVIYATESEDLLKHALFHELGHSVYYQYLDSKQRKNWVRRLSGRKSKYFVSLYAARNAAEDFAECYAFFVLQSEALDYYPKKKAFLEQEVFSTEEKLAAGKETAGRFDVIA